MCLSLAHESSFRALLLLTEKEWSCLFFVFVWIQPPSKKKKKKKKNDDEFYEDGV